MSLPIPHAVDIDPASSRSRIIERSRIRIIFPHMFDPCAGAFSVSWTDGSARAIRAGCAPSRAAWMSDLAGRHDRLLLTVPSRDRADRPVMVRSRETIARTRALAPTHVD